MAHYECGQSHLLISAELACQKLPNVERRVMLFLEKLNLERHVFFFVVFVFIFATRTLCFGSEKVDIKWAPVDPPMLIKRSLGTRFVWSAANGRLNNVVKMLEAQPDPSHRFALLRHKSDSVFNPGMNALIAAASRGNTDVVMLLF